MCGSGVSYNLSDGGRVLLLRPRQRALEEGKGCCIMSKAAKGERGKKVLDATTKEEVALFFEPQYSASSILVPATRVDFGSFKCVVMLFEVDVRLPRADVKPFEADVKAA
nr:hypothetical protein [Tanacetum cinerariifolium]